MADNKKQESCPNCNYIPGMEGFCRIETTGDDDVYVELRNDHVGVMAYPVLTVCPACGVAFIPGAPLLDGVERPDQKE